MNPTRGADLCGIAVNWHLDEKIEELIQRWPDDPRFELIVVDNSSTLESRERGPRIVSPGRNIGFGGAINLGCRETDARIVLILNPDAIPRPHALDALLEGFERWPSAIGIAPRMVGADDQLQTRWQIRPLPSPWTLLLHCLFIPAGQGDDIEPADGTVVEQPAAAALALRRVELLALGGFDETFYPAWFEDVDLAARIRNQGAGIRYFSKSEFDHGLGASVAILGYPRFVTIYYQNLCRYLNKHHGSYWTILARSLICLSVPARVLLLPVRKPRRASSKREAARGLLALLRGALNGWQTLERTPEVTT